jgi:L-alanine-DL-glutamate epimerase-like enolase superfamily enzyme
VPAAESTVRPDDHAAYRELRAKKAVPFASGEHEADEAGFQDLIDSQAADYIQVDVCCQGGFAMGQRIFALVAKKRLRFAFHSGAQRWRFWQRHISESAGRLTLWSGWNIHVIRTSDDLACIHFLWRMKSWASRWRLKAVT